MERTKYQLTVILLLLGLNQIPASNSQKIYVAYYSGKMQSWKSTIDAMQLSKEKSNEYLLELINFQYGYIAWCIGNNRTSDARKYLDLAFENLAVLENIKYQMSMTNAYRAAFYGFEIGLAKYRAPYFGLKSIDASKKAIEYDNNNWMAYIQSANIQYYIPPMFGGSKKEALLNYEKALRLLEARKELTYQNWNYLNLLIIIAQGYTELADYQKAEFYYQKLLEVEPGFTWVKDELYPNILILKSKKN